MFGYVWFLKRTASLFEVQRVGDPLFQKDSAAENRPMITIIFACVCWLTVPTLFAPYPTWQNLCEASSELPQVTALLRYNLYHVMVNKLKDSCRMCLYKLYVISIFAYTIKYCTHDLCNFMLVHVQDVEAFYHFMMRCPADRSRAELYTNRRPIQPAAAGRVTLRQDVDHHLCQWQQTSTGDRPQHIDLWEQHKAIHLLFQNVTKTHVSDFFESKTAVLRIAILYWHQISLG